MTQNFTQTAADDLGTLAERAASQAEKAISSSRRTANDVLKTFDTGVDTFRQEASGAIARTAEQLDELARRGIHKARQSSAELRYQVERSTQRSVDYIKDEPVKAVLIAAAAGAALAGLFSLLAKRRRTTG
jgi:ElaB/YqjD/DUF883 family membrane-anchored ribosome-binding protein